MAILVGGWGAFTAVWGGGQLAAVDDINFSWGLMLLLLAAFVISTATHELLHGIGFSLGGAAWGRDIRFGFTKMTPYAHCAIPLRPHVYRTAVALPGLMLGVLPLLGGILFGSLAITFYGAFMTAAASGDLMILWLLRDIPAGAWVQDHPSLVGCRLLLPTD